MQDAGALPDCLSLRPALPLCRSPQQLCRHNFLPCVFGQSIRHLIRAGFIRSFDITRYVTYMPRYAHYAPPTQLAQFHPPEVSAALNSPLTGSHAKVSQHQETRFRLLSIDSFALVL